LDFPKPFSYELADEERNYEWWRRWLLYNEEYWQEYMIFQDETCTVHEKIHRWYASFWKPFALLPIITWILSVVQLLIVVLSLNDGALFPWWNWPSILALPMMFGWWCVIVYPFGIRLFAEHVALQRLKQRRRPQRCYFESSSGPIPVKMTAFPTENEWTNKMRRLESAQLLVLAILFLPDKIWMFSVTVMLSCFWLIKTGRKQNDCFISRQSMGCLNGAIIASVLPFIANNYSFNLLPLIAPICICLSTLWLEATWGTIVSVTPQCFGIITLATSAILVLCKIEYWYNSDNLFNLGLDWFFSFAPLSFNLFALGVRCFF